MLGEISGVLQLPYLFIIQGTVGSSDTLICSGDHQHLLLVLRRERIRLISCLRNYLPLAPGLSHH
jgi:hypothetical protein